MLVLITVGGKDGLIVFEGLPTWRNTQREFTLSIKDKEFALSSLRYNSTEGNVSSYPHPRCVKEFDRFVSSLEDGTLQEHGKLHYKHSKHEGESGSFDAIIMVNKW